MSTARRHRAIAACHDALVQGVRADVYVLDQGTRAISASGLRRVVGGARQPVAVRAFLASLLGSLNVTEADSNIEIVSAGGVVWGYPIGFLRRVAGAITDARLDGKFDGALEHLGPRAREIENSTSEALLVALVDEATGYRARHEFDSLARKYGEYLLPTPGKWEFTFPNEFYKQLARLYRVQLKNNSLRPAFFGRFTDLFIYSAIDRDVARELRRRNPKPHFGRNHHQHLTPRARALLAAHLARVTTVMRQSVSPADFHMRFRHEFFGSGLQLSLVGMAA